MNRPQQFTATVIKIDKLNTHISEFNIELSGPTSITFLPGQFVSVEVDTGVYRSYSINSSNKNDKFITLLVDTSLAGIGSKYFNRLKVGDKVSFVGPSGKFTLPAHITGELIFVCTGTGLAPFESMLRKLTEQNYTDSISLYMGIRTKEDKFKIEFLDKLTQELTNFGYYMCLSKDKPTETYEKSGRVTEYIPYNRQATYMLCGNPNMIIEVEKLLVENGINIDRILYEKFTTTGAS